MHWRGPEPDQNWYSGKIPKDGKKKDEKSALKREGPKTSGKSTDILSSGWFSKEVGQGKEENHQDRTGVVQTEAGRGGEKNVPL